VTKLEDASVKDLSTALAVISLDGKVTLPRRPEYGVEGTPVTLWTNYFEISVNDNTELYRYSVAFQPDEDLPKPKKKRIIQLLLKKVPFAGIPVVSDWAQMLVSRKRIDLGSDRGEYEIEWYPEDGDPLPPGDGDARRARARQRNTVKVLVKKIIGTISVQDLKQDLKKQSPMVYLEKQELVQALNIVLSSGPSTDRDHAIAGGGNKFFPFCGPQHQSVSLGGGLQALRGYYTSVRTSVNRILINVNVASAAFYEHGPLLELLRKIRVDDQGKNLTMSQMEKFVRKLRFKTDYIRKTDENGKVKMSNGKPVPKPKVHTIFALSGQNHNSETVTFKLDDGTNISVKDFFARTHNKRLEHPNAPLVNYGSTDDPKWIPSELCTILPGQVAKRLLMGKQTSAMINFAARRPVENAKSIEGNGLKVIKLEQGLKGKLDDFDIGVSQKMLTVPGRVLTPPLLQYREKTFRPIDGQWNLDRRQFNVTKPLGEWSCLVINSGNRPTLQGGLQDAMTPLIEFGKVLHTYGMAPDPVKPPSFLNINPNYVRERNVVKLKKEISDHLEKIMKPKFLLVLLPNNDSVLYDCIKSTCDVDLGIPNICSIGSKFIKCQRQYFANIAMKFNQKLGGVNQMIELESLKPIDASTIIFGIDVTHPSPGSADSAPSIAGVVASVDANFSQYPASMRTQRGKVEMVTALEEMIVERLKLWQKKNGKLPERVIVYRDGVSEGQFSIVMEQEYPQFVKAFEKLYHNAKHPKVSIIVVGKRHHTRFYPTDVKGADSTGNAKPGTVVDRGITGERLFDFFLLAHQGLKGTSKPAHYVVLKDDNYLGADRLQELVSGVVYGR
jgi:eukaryotic translation initiation factor 2C